jgi:hypothetical protein
MPKKTILEALTRVKMLALPQASCCALRRAVELTTPPVKAPNGAQARSGLQVIARSITVKRLRHECSFRGRRTSQNPTSRWFCPVAMNTISGNWLDLS